MNRSTITRRLAQVTCLALVFGLGSGIVFSQDADRKILKRVEPEYPAVLRDKGIGGVVKLRVLVRTDGTVKGYQTLSAANSATTKLGEKTRQLISLAVAITTKCDGCIVHHTEAALKAGASREEIAEALGVAVAMNAGAALVYSTRVLDAVEAKSAAAHG